MITVQLPPTPAPVQPMELDAESLGGAVTELLAASTQVDEAGAFCAGDARIDGWTGAGSQSYHRSIRRLGYSADAHSLALRSLARRLEDHAEAMDLLRERQVELEGRAKAHTRAIRDFEQRVQEWVASTKAEGLPEAAAERLEQQGERLVNEAERLSVETKAIDDEAEEIRKKAIAHEQSMIAAFRENLTPDEVHAEYGGQDDPADEALESRPSDGTPEENREWWESLSPEQQQALIAAHPGAVGDLDGLPAQVRDEANRIALERDIAGWEELGDDRTDAEDKYLENALAAEEALGQHAGERDANGDEIPILLWTYDPEAFDGDGRVAVAVGDPDTADAVSVSVPGFKTDGTDIPGYTEDAFNLNQSAQTADPSQSYATIAWLGYDAPNGNPFTGDSAGVVSQGFADAGGDLLADALDGLNASRDDDFRLVPIGHSYGSVVTGSALSQHDVDVDRAAVVGSPGLGNDVDTVDDLKVPEGEFFVGRNSDDGVAGLGQNGWFGLGDVGHGYDPSDVDFGAQRFRAEDEGRNGRNDFGHNHTAYYDPDTESLSNLGIILAGGDPVGAEGAHDPWYWTMQDPEADREVTTPRTTP